MISLKKLQRWQFVGKARKLVAKVYRPMKKLFWPVDKLGAFLAKLPIFSHINEHLPTSRRGKLVGGILLVLPIVIAVGLMFKFGSQEVEAGWFNDHWRYRKEIEIDNDGSSTLSNFQVELDEVDVDGLYDADKLNADCSDLRFVDVHGIEMDYWVEDEGETTDLPDCSGGWGDVDVWVKVPEIQPGGTKIYMYYGNPSAQSGSNTASYKTSNGKKVFEFFDDFTGSSVGGKWTTNGSPAVSNGNLELQDAGDTGLEGVLSQDTFCDSSPGNGDACVVEFKAEQSAASLHKARLGFSNTSDFDSFDFDETATTFTAGAAKRDGGGPFAGGIFLQGGSSTDSDLLYFTAGSDLDGSRFNQNLDLNQGTLGFWITPEWNGNNGETHQITWGRDQAWWGIDLSKTSGGLLKFHINGGQVTTDVSSWVAGETYFVTLRWDSDNTLDGTNHMSISIDDSHVFGETSSFNPNAVRNDHKQYIGSRNTSDNSLDALIEGLTIYRRPLFDGTNGIDVGNGDEINQIYNSGSGKDPTLVTGSWDVVFALPTDASTGALSTGTGEAWSHPHSSNLLYTDTTNTGGFMMNGTYTADGWADEGTPTSVSTLATSEKIFAGGYKFTSDAANEGIYYDLTVSEGDDWAVRALAHSDGTSVPKIILYDQTNGAEIGSLTGTSTSTRSDPDVFTFTGEAPSGMTTLRVKLVNTQSSGTTYWHQVEVLENRINNPSLEGEYAGDPLIPPGYSGGSGLESGDSTKETSIVHSGNSSLKINTPQEVAFNNNIFQSMSNGYVAHSFVMSGTFGYVETPTLGHRNNNRSKHQATNQSNYFVEYGDTPWTHTPRITRQSTITGAQRYIEFKWNTTNAVGYMDDAYSFRLNDVSLTVTPATEENSTESTGIRVDGTDTLTQSINTFSSTSGKTRFKYTPRHSAADVAKFGESTPYIATFWGDADDYIKLYWSAANTITLSYSMDGTTGSDTYDATGAIAAGTTYDMEVGYSGDGDMTLAIDDTTQVTLSSIPSSFGTTPSTVHWGTDYDGTNDTSRADATFAAPTPFFSTDDSAGFALDSTTGGNHETESANGGSVETSSVGVAEDTSFHNYSISVDSSSVTYDVDGTTASHSTQVPNVASYLRFDTTDSSNILKVDHVFVRKLATTEPAVEAYASYGAEEQGTGPVAWYTFDEGSGSTAYNEMAASPPKDPVLHLSMDDGVSGDGQTISDSSGYGSDGTTEQGDNATGMDCTVEGKIGSGACDFDGEDDFINAGTDSSISITHPLTLNVWVKASSFGTLNTILAKRNNSGTNYALRLENSNKLTYYFNSSGWQTFKWDYSFNTNTWYHVVVTHDENGNIYSYINGTKQNKKTTALTATDGGASLGIGAYVRDNNTADEFFNGEIDEVKIYDYTLTEAQIRAEYENTHATLVPGSSGDNTTATDMWSSGKVGQGAMEFDGEDDYALIPHNPQNGITDDTISGAAWVKLNSAPEANDATIFAKGSGYYFSIDTDLKPRVYFYGTNPQQWFVAEDTINLNEWTHIAFTYDGSDIKIYINGQENNSESRSRDINSSTSSLAIGAVGKDGGVEPNRRFDGTIDDVRLYDHALTEDQVKEIYNQNAGAVAGTSQNPSTAGLDNGLVGYWRMDESSWNGTSGEVVDFSGSGNHGAAVGDATTASGKFGNAGSFDGDGDYVDLPNHIDTYSGDGFTVAGWVYWQGAGVNNGWNPITSDGTGNGQHNTFFIHDGEGDALKYKYFNNSENVSNVISSNLAIENSTWTFVVLKFDKESGKYTFYRNLETDESSGGHVGDNFDGIGMIGARHPDQDTFNGNIDELRVYNRPLSTNEIEDLYLYGPGPVAEYDFNEGEGVVVGDTSGNGNDGVSYSGANISELEWTGEGKFGGAMEFDGTDDYVNSSFGPNFGDNNFSISLWTKANSLTDGDINALLGTVAETGTGDELVFIQFDGSNCLDGQISFSLRDTDSGVTTHVCTNSTYNDNQWHHILAVFDNSNAKIKLYVDGKESKSTDIGSNSDGLKDFSSYPFYIGARNNRGTAEKFFDGSIDEVKIYNYALNQREIAMLYDTSRTPDAVGYWKFDEGSGTTAYDAGTGDNNGTINGASWQDEGKYGKALEFDGSGDYVNMGSPSTLDDLPNDSFAVSAWIKPNSSTDYARIIDKRINSDEGWSFYYRSNGSLGFNMPSLNVSSFETPENAITHNVWQHVSAIYNDSDNTFTLYINGVSYGQTSTSGTYSSDALNDLVIGARGDGGNLFYNGAIDEVKIYNYALNQREVNEVYTQTASMVLGQNVHDIQNNLADGLVGWWKMDDNVSGNAHTITDHSGNGNDGTTNYGANGTGMDCTVAGQYGYGCDFDGEDDYVSVGDNSTLDVTQSITLSTWAKFDSVTGYNLFAPHKYVSGGNQRSYRIYSDNQTIIFALSSDGSSDSSSYTAISYDSSITTGRWYNITATYDYSSSTMRLYLDGKEVASETHTGGIYQSTANVRIGFDEGAQYHDGLIDDVRVYNRALSSKEASQLYSYGQPPVAHWSLDEGSGTTAGDISANSNDGTLGGDGAGSEVPSWTGKGKFGNALEFDGSDDVVEGPNMLSGKTNNFSIQAWVKFDDLQEGHRPILDIGGDTCTGVKLQQGVSTSGGSTINVHFRCVSQTVIQTSSFDSEKWQHISITRDENTTYLYKNGVLLGSDNTQSPLAPTSGLLINPKNFSNNVYIDDVRIYNYARTPRQILQDMNGDTPGPHPIAKWSFDEGAGQYTNSTHADKLKINDIDVRGTLGSSDTNTTSDPTWITDTSSCRTGGCLDFDGSGDEVVLSGEYGGTNWSETTVSAWFKPDSLDSLQAVIAPTDTKFTHLQVGGIGTIPIYTDSSTIQFNSITNQVNNQSWHHVVISAKSGDSRLYLDGVEVQSDNTSFSYIKQATNLQIGSGFSGDRHFDGKIDEVQIFNHALTEEEVKTLYTGGAVNFQ